MYLYMFMNHKSTISVLYVAVLKYCHLEIHYLNYLLTFDLNTVTFMYIRFANWFVNISPSHIS